MADSEVVGIDGAEDDHELVAERWRSRTEVTGLRDSRAPDQVGDADSLATRYAPEDRDRSAYFDELRDADGSARDGARRDGESSWDSAVLRFRERWAEHQERWPIGTRDAVDRSADPPGSWRGDSGRYLDATDNAEVEARCERIAEAERTTISPAMRAIEAADPTRELVGWDQRLKGAERIKDKVADLLGSRPGLTCSEATSTMPDSVRYTFTYQDSQYTAGVRSDVDRLRADGFELVRLRNTWSSEHYRGINSQWKDGDGQRFEVQFHTHASLEAKELTHCAYEKARNPLTLDAERDEVLGYQRELYRDVPQPERVLEIKDYPPRKLNG